VAKQNNKQQLNKAFQTIVPGGLTILLSAVTAAMQSGSGDPIQSGLTLLMINTVIIISDTFGNRKSKLVNQVSQSINRYELKQD